MSSIKKQPTQIHGIASSQLLDSSGERIEIKDLDISSYESGTGFINFEHKGDLPQQVLGRIKHAKKIFTPEDCSTEAERKFFDQVKAPYVYIIAELFDADEGHEAAKSVASVFRQDFEKSTQDPHHKPFFGFSVEGATLDRDGHKITKSIARGCTITSKPCNKSCIAELYVPEQVKKKDPLDFLKSEPEMYSLMKAMTAGGGNAAPSTLSGGSALQSEEIEPKLYGKIRKFIEQKFSKKPNAEKEYLTKALHDKILTKAEEAMEELYKAPKNDLPPVDFMDTPSPKKPKVDKSAALTIHGNPVTPNFTIKQGTKSTFDSDKGVLSTPRGDFPMFMPKASDKQYQNILNSPDVKDVHERAMSNWLHLNKLRSSGQALPDQIGAHANIFSIMSANNPVPSQELSYSRFVDTLKDKGLTPGTQKFADAMKVGGEGRSHFLGSDSPTEFPKHARDYWTGRAKGAITQKEDSDLTGRKTGEIIRPGFGEVWADRVSHYDPEVHNYFTNLYNQYGSDSRGLVSEAMAHKSASDKLIPKGHPIKRGVGLSSKTLRYAANMAGGGNAVIPDTHFIRHTFGLDQNKDAATIEHLKSILLNPKNHHLLNGIDKSYLNHPAARHVQQKYFNGEQNPNSIFPAFWQHWLSIPHHEKALGIGNPQQAKNQTDHTPYWDMADEILDKHGLGRQVKKNESENDPIAVRSARAVHEMTDKIGSAPASMVYYAHIVPQLIAHSKNPRFPLKPRY